MRKEIPKNWQLGKPGQLKQSWPLKKTTINSLTNVVGVSESFLAAEADMSNKAYEVYLVTTSHAPWYVWCVRREGRSFFDFTTPDERAYEVDPELLVPSQAVNGKLARLG